MLKYNFVFLFVVLSVLLVAPVSAKSTFNWGKEVNASNCDKVGNPVVSVHEKVLNTVDSGLAGNYWAYDNLNRTLQVWEQKNGTYCILVKNTGSFDAQENQVSPGNTEVLAGDEDGTFQGGYRATVVGTLLADPFWETQGNVGVTDYMCDLSGVCPGYVNWLGQYFEPGYSFTYDWWGWIYHGNTSSTWVNSSDGTFGDVL